MQEKFDKWCKVKKEIDKIILKDFYVKQGQVWYIYTGKNVGYESNGKGDDFKRPVLVLKKVGSLFFVASMTTKGKDNSFYYKLDKSYFGKDSYITLSQVKIIDKKRFINEIGKISGNDFRNIKKELQKILF